MRAALEGVLALTSTIAVNLLEILRNDDIALIISYWAADGTDADGNPVSLASEALEVLRRGEDGSWRFVIDNPWGAPPSGAAK